MNKFAITHPAEKSDLLHRWLRTKGFSFLRSVSIPSARMTVVEVDDKRLRYSEDPKHNPRCPVLTIEQFKKNWEDYLRGHYPRALRFLNKTI